MKPTLLLLFSLLAPVCGQDGRFVGQSFRCDVSHGKDDKTFRYCDLLPKQGRYEVRYAYANIRGADKSASITLYIGLATARIEDLIGKCFWVSQPCPRVKFS